MAKVVIVDSDFSDHELEMKMAREAGSSFPSTRTEATRASSETPLMQMRS